MQIQLTLTATDKSEMNQLISIAEMVARTTSSGILTAVKVDEGVEETKPGKKKKAKAEEIEAPKKKKKKEIEPEEDEDDDEDLDDEDESEDDSDDEESEDEDEDDAEEDDEDSDDEEDEKPAPKKRGPKPKASKEVAPVKEEKKTKSKEPKQQDLIDAFSNLAKVKGRGKAKKALEKLGVVSVRDIKEKDYAKALAAFKA